MDTRTKIQPFDQALANPPSSDAAIARGRFDVLTANHCRALSDLASTAAETIALVAADDPSRPTILDAVSRAQLVAALGSVDRVIICDLAQSQQLVASFKPATTVDIEAEVTRDVVCDVLAKHSAMD